jgi:hypothetical protein
MSLIRWEGRPLLLLLLKMRWEHCWLLQLLLLSQGKRIWLHLDTQARLREEPTAKAITLSAARPIKPCHMQVVRIALIKVAGKAQVC